MHVVLDTPGGVGLYYSYNVIAWVITPILIALGLWQVTLNKKIYYSNMLVWLGLGCLFLVIPIFYDFEFTDHAIPRVLALIGGLLFLFSLYQFQLPKHDALQLLCLILVAVALEATFGLVQFFLLEDGDWGGYKIGRSRPHGVFLQPNVMASFMATGFAIALFFSTNKSLFNKAKLFNGFVLSSLFITTFLLVLLQSRTGFVAVFLVLLLSAPYIYQQSKKQFYINLMVVFLAVVSALSALNNSNTPIRDEHVYKTTDVRYDIIVVGIDMIKTKPLLGFGYGNFERSFIDYFNNYAIEHPEIGDTLTNFAHPHNEILFWVIEGGLIALLAFIFFIVGFLVTWLKIPIKQGLILLSLPLPLLIHSQLEFPFYSSVSHWLVFLILVWISDKYAMQSKTKISSISCNKTFLIRFFAILIPAIFVPFMITAQHTAHILVEHEKDLTNPTAFARLNNIINPIAWQSRLDAAVYAHILISGLQEKDNEKLTSYLNWALKRIKHKPRPILYRNVLLVLKKINRTEQYQVVLAEAKHTYPQESDWKNSPLQEKYQ
ncbi:PglL family O-oligosaccharyltransferase [Colwellia echini]|uniref:Virulence factor membrane-bound polymerase C-terminal domain-containing protein n=1 Tax=Colwellia echini TaxID=1982103 RepID=A0ABY3N119_9GAMM|nr:PglL family O-oligosaccharyltransferase [Colwellia echini]TYK67148.1 hypothetical protein CWS31_001020 [Colwellia echini]